jgi:hypothetical protein
MKDREPMNEIHVCDRAALAGHNPEVVRSNPAVYSMNVSYLFVGPAIAPIQCQLF